MSYPEYYEILKVKSDASTAEIKRSYSALAKKLHPDLNINNKKSEELLKKVNEAYSVLKNADKRAEYDYFGKQAQEAERQSKAQNAASVNTSPKENAAARKASSASKKCKFVGILINKSILILLLIAYGWLFYINTDKNEPYNVFKTLLNTSDYLLERISENITKVRRYITSDFHLE